MYSRRAFVLGGLTVGIFPAPLRAQPAISLAYLASVPGSIGVYARTMREGPPIVAYHDDESFPTASTIKVLIMATAFRELDAGMIKIDTPVMISRDDMVGGSDTFQNADPGRRYPLGSLIDAMIKQSDNTASNALISHLGFDAIHRTALTAGMTSTQLRRHFLDWTAIVKHNENVSTPRDMATLLYQIERGSREGIATIASSYSCRQMIEIMLGQEDRDKIPRGLPHGTHVANKTGEITGVRSDVAIVEPFGDLPYIITVMTKELQDYGAGIAAIARVAHDVNKAVMTGG